MHPPPHGRSRWYHGIDPQDGANHPKDGLAQATQGDPGYHQHPALCSQEVDKSLASTLLCH